MQIQCAQTFLHAPMYISKHFRRMCLQQVPQVVATAVKVLGCAIKTPRIMKEFIPSQGLHMLVQLLLGNKMDTEEVVQGVLHVIHKASAEENGSKYLAEALERKRGSMNGFESLISRILTGSHREKVTTTTILRQNTIFNLYLYTWNDLSEVLFIKLSH